jgi:dTDP-4-amino-4,6-dideoxygalactose transaminase
MNPPAPVTRTVRPARPSPWGRALPLPLTVSSLGAMPEWKVPLADLRAAPEDIEAVVQTYRSGWLSMGPRTESLERAFARYAGARHAVAVTNGTAALHLMCAAAGLGPGDEVVVPSLTFVATANAIAYVGARPVFAEIAGLTEPWLSARAAESALTPRTKAIMTVAYGGHPGETEELLALAAERGIALLEDAAHAAGARYHGRHLGTLGLAGAFSFFSNKNLGIGEGGMVVTDDDELAERIRLLRSHGMTTLTWDRHRGHASGYDVVALGFNYRIDEPRAAFAEERLRRLDDDNRERARLDARYRRALSDLPGLEPTLPPPADAVPANHLFTVVVEDGLDRERVRASLADRGVQTSVHYPPVHRFSIHSDRGVELPLTEAYALRTVTLPLFAHMSDTQQDLVVEALANAVATAAPVR